MGIFDNLRAALKAKAPTSADLERAVVDAQGAVADANARLGELQRGRLESLTASDTDRAAYKRRVAMAEDELADAELYASELAARLERVRQEEAEQARMKAYLAASEAASAAAERLAKEYPHVARSLVDLIREVATATEAVEAVNRDLPEGRDRLVDPERRVRDRPSLLQKEIKRKRVWRWCQNEGRVVMSEDATVIPDSLNSSTGTYAFTSGGTHKTTIPVVKRQFDEVTFHPSEPGKAGRRLAEINLPGLKADDPPFWVAFAPASARDIRQSIEELKAKPPAPTAREVAVELIPLPVGGGEAKPPASGEPTSD